jgi:Fe-S-cluster-containing dehydrogenase component
MIINRKRFLQITGFPILAAVGAPLTVRSLRAVTELKNSNPPRWAMAIDLGKCLQKEGCTKCVEACHQFHNVPNFTAQAHRIDWIRKAGFESAFPGDPNEYQIARLKKAPVPLLCNHCENPPCVRVCPTQATWRRNDGIVMMDWHRCIGCRYCMAACPYGSRSFNWTNPRSYLAKLNPDFSTRTKGVVEKCNFCEEKIGKGDRPLCVEACPQEAMVFGNLYDTNSDLRELLQTRFTIRRKPELGTNPRIFYIV